MALLLQSLAPPSLVRPSCGPPLMRLSSCHECRADLRAKFPDKPWLDVLSKADMLEEEFDAADERHAAQHAAAAGGSDGSGSGDGSREGEGGAAAAAAGEPAPAGAASAVEFAAALPGALRVSSLTGAGVEDLKARMLALLAEAQLARDGVEGWWGAAGEAGTGEAEASGEDELIFLEDEEHRQHGF